MKKVLIVAVVVCAAFSSCGGSKNIKSYSELDSLSYAIGLDIAMNMTNIRAVLDSTLQGDAIAAAFRDVMNDKPQMTLEDAGAFINEYIQVRMPARAAAENKAWFDEVKATNPNIQTTASGLMYEIINAGDAAIKATPADQVIAKYRGTLKDGSEFDANENATFPLSGVIQGWIEGLQLIGKGGEIVLWVPAELAYGPQARQGIPANSPLKFEVTLLDVIPAAVAE